jgi:hypothetical protein
MRTKPSCINRDGKLMDDRPALGNVTRLHPAARAVAGREEAMPQTLIIYDFGANEEAAQQARHRLEGWRQAFRLGDRLKLKFERQAASSASMGESAAGETGDETKRKSAGKGSAATEETQQAQASDAESLRLIVRLEFSSHERLSYQQWFDRLGAEPSLQGTDRRVLQRGEEGFDSVADTFDSLP